MLAGAGTSHHTGLGLKVVISSPLWDFTILQVFKWSVEVGDVPHLGMVRDNTIHINVSKIQRHWPM